MTKITIGTPMYGGKSEMEFELSMLYLMKKATQFDLDISLLQIKGEAAIQRGRNNIAQEFLKTDSEYLMFIDADIGFVPEFVSDLVKTGEPLIGGIYPKKMIDKTKYVKAFNEGRDPDHDSGIFVVKYLPGNTQIKDAMKPFEVRSLGTGFLLTHRSVFEKILSDITLPKYNCTSWFTRETEEFPAFYDMPISNGEFLSEDFFFCELARSVGFKVMAAPWMHFKHVATYAYRGCFLCSMGSHLHDTKLDLKP